MTKRLLSKKEQALLYVIPYVKSVSEKSIT